MEKAGITTYLDFDGVPRTRVNHRNVSFIIYKGVRYYNCEGDWSSPLWKSQRGDRIFGPEKLNATLSRNPEWNSQGQRWYYDPKKGDYFREKIVDGKITLDPTMSLRSQIDGSTMDFIKGYPRPPWLGAPSGFNAQNYKNWFKRCQKERQMPGVWVKCRIPNLDDIVRNGCLSEKVTITRDGKEKNFFHYEIVLKFLFERGVKIPVGVGSDYSVRYGNDSTFWYPDIYELNTWLRFNGIYLRYETQPRHSSTLYCNPYDIMIEKDCGEVVSVPLSRLSENERMLMDPLLNMIIGGMDYSIEKDEEDKRSYRLNEDVADGNILEIL